MEITRVGIDTAKSVFDVCGSDRYGKILLKAKYSRNLWIAVIKKKFQIGFEIVVEAYNNQNYGH